MKDVSRFHERSYQTKIEVDYRRRLGRYFSQSPGTHVEKLEHFPKYVPRQQLARFLAKYQLFCRILHIHGSIVECGVGFGGGCMTWAQLSACLEPYNHQRRVIGFDTFTGFVSIGTEDSTSTSERVRPGGLAVDSLEDLIQCILLFDMNRPLNHIWKVKLVRGDVAETIPKFLEEYPATVISLLYLDLDLYEPTLVALKHLMLRVPRGGIIAFDQLNCERFPGETIAAINHIGLNNLALRRIPFEPSISYAVVQ